MEPGSSMLIHKGSPIIPILGRINPIPRIDTYFTNVHFNIVLPSTPSLPKGLFPVDLPVKMLKALLPPSILATWPVHLNPLDLITLTIWGERYRLWSSLLWNLLYLPFLGPNIHLRILFQIALAWIPPLM